MSGFRVERSIWVFAVLALALIAAGCTTSPSRQAGGGSPHYKVGKPYKVNGRWYRPAEDPDYSKVGVASWYGRDFHGRKTANGEIYNMNALTAAHTTLPMPSMVEVENLENRRRVVVRVNDRGPFANNRIIDLSREAARRLGFEKKGLAKVRVRYLGPAPLPGQSPRSRQVARAAPRVSRPPPSPAEQQPEPESVPAITQARNGVTGAFKTIEEQPAPTPEVEAVEPAPPSRTATPPMLASLPDEPVETLYAIRVAALSSLDNIEALRTSLGPVGPLRMTRVETDDGRIFYRVNMGPYSDQAEAARRLEAVREAGYNDAALVVITP